jgi:hypothetical protein
MRIDNKESIGMVNIHFSIMIISMLTVLVVNYVTELLSYSDETVYSIWGVLLITVFVYRYGGFEYVSFTFNDTEVDIKYYRLFPFNRKFNRIVIPNEMLGDFKIHKGIGVIFSALILYQNRGGAMAQYPPIGIAATSKSMRDKLMKKLNDLKI